MGKLPIVNLLLVVSIIALVVEFRMIYNNHPILYGWLSGTAQVIGKPINATVYTDGCKTNSITVYKVRYPDQKKDDYLLILKEPDKDQMLKFVLIDLNDKWVGRTICSNVDCYDTIEGVLFQNDVGSHFVDFKNDMKGFDFDPQLTFTNTEIKFNMPPKWLKFDSVRIELNKK